MTNKNGWSKMPHAISDAMGAMSLPELACTMLLVRETYGWHHSYARLTYQDFTRLHSLKTNISRRPANQQRMALKIRCC